LFAHGRLANVIRQGSGPNGPIQRIFATLPLRGN
jgi:hypothetical protein